MRFNTLTLASVGLAAVHGLPLDTGDDIAGSGCRMSLTPTLSQPQNAASNILYSTLSKWVTSTNSLYFSSNYLDTRNTTKAPFSVMFKANMIPDYLSEDSIAAVLDTWMGTYLIGGATPAHDDYAITQVKCA
ncbi:hypothetical protein F5Y12DRAFT_715341 [Xylaria sp. FL1777]|nr:hypothetical protein F5Y12DRAFT_715341 [Xylaria sp. FL1777]